MSPRHGFRASGSRIGRLQRDLREKVNEMIAEAKPAAEIVAHIHERGHTEITPSNVESWRESGYLDYLDRIERLNQIRLRGEASLEMVKTLSDHGRMPISEANDLRLASLIADALDQYTPEMMAESLAENPKHFFSLTTAIRGQTAERSRRAKLDLDVQKFLEAVKTRKEKLQTSLREASRNGGITPETLAQIEEHLNLL